MKKEKILFFIADFVPSEDEKKAAEKLGTKMFRCAKMVLKTSPIEDCDDVAGCVPESYNCRRKKKEVFKKVVPVEPKLSANEQEKQNEVKIPANANQANSNAPAWRPN